MTAKQQILCFSIFLWCKIVFAQQLAYVNYGVDDGLPSSEVYQSIQDDRGFMWFGTDRGLVRYDGYDLKVFTQKDGLSGDVIFGFHKDHQNRIWLNIYDGGVNYLVEDSIVVPSFNDSLKKAINSRVVSALYVDKEETLWISFKRSNDILKVDSTGNISRELIGDFRQLGHITQIDSTGVIFGNGSRVSGNKEAILFNRSQYIKVQNEKIISHRGLSAVLTNKGVYGTQNETIFQISDTTTTSSSLPGLSTMSLCKDSRGNVWSGTYKKGAVRYLKGSLEKEPMRYLLANSVSSIYEDRSGGYWFTTLYDGIYYCSNLNVFSKQYITNNKAQPLRALYFDDEYLWIGTNNGEVIKQSFNLSEGSEVVSNNNNEISHIIKGANSIWAIVYSPYNVREDHDEIRPINTKTAWVDINSDSIWYAGSNNEKEREEMVLLGHTLIEIDLIESINRLHMWNNKLFAGTRRGLFEVKDRTHSYKNESVEHIENVWVVDIASNKNLMVVGTKKRGIFIFDGEKILHEISTKDGLPLNRIESVYLENDSLVWVGTKKGLSKVEINGNGRVLVKNLTTSEGLIDNEINDIIKVNDHVMVATSKGLSYFNSKIDFNSELEFAKRANLPLFITSIIANNEVVDRQRDSVFSHDKKIFDFEFLAIDYRESDKISYKYLLEGFDKKWTSTSARNVRYMLQPGSYTFQVKATNSTEGWSDIQTYSFSITLPIWQENWFVSLCIFVLLSIIYAFFYWRFRIKSQQAALELQMVKSQHSALSAQLKPHFVFNALNSINNFVLKNDKISSSKYLSLFAKLIRQVLANSNNPIAILEEEIDLIEKYLQIEQLRFKEKMEFTIEVDPKLDQKVIKIPSQVIQPYIENAIWHGIMNKETKGSIVVKISKKEDALLLIIEDDGIGREATFRLKKATVGKHKSLGMSITDRRIKLISALFKKEMKVMIEDLKDERGKAVGTRVKMILPVLK